MPALKASSGTRIQAKRLLILFNVDTPLTLLPVLRPPFLVVRELCGWLPPKQKCKFDIIEWEMYGLNDCVDDMNDAIGGQEIGLLDKG